jgi:hypothetical protein
VTPTVIDQLNREWARLADDPRVARRLQHVCEAAGGSASLRDLQRYVETASPADADRVLVALVGPASAGAELEARVLLQLLMPAVRRLIRRWWTGGDRDERAAIVLAAVWQQTTNYRLDRRPQKVALNIVMDARWHEWWHAAELERPSALAEDLSPGLSCGTPNGVRTRVSTLRERWKPSIPSVIRHFVPVESVSSPGVLRCLLTNC